MTRLTCLSFTSALMLAIAIATGCGSPQLPTREFSISPSPISPSPVATPSVKAAETPNHPEFTEELENEATQFVQAPKPRRTLDDRLLFFPSKHPDGNWEPERLQYQDVWMTAADKTRIHGWYCPVDKPLAHVLFAHGNAGNITHRASLLAMLQAMGISALAFDYRGYGKSEGLPSKDGVVQDGAAARTKLASLGGVRERDVVLMGRSLGGAVVIQLAADAPARGLIVESSFSSLSDVAKHHYPRLAWIVNPDSLNSTAALAKYRGPFLQSHGDADRTIPFALGKKLFESANEPKRFVTIARGDHNSPQSAEYYRALAEFITSL
ncbi:MAG: alpha/beta hydrolase [Planctomycetales bacterium]|nr:alpha/beta hydrolase [Planctomycetales bacterium]